jgi:hypothetical protein
MSEAENNVGDASDSGNKRFLNGDVNPDNKDLVCWGYRGDDPWWVDWSTYWRMAKRHKGVVRQKRRKDGVVKRGIL